MIDYPPDHEAIISSDGRGRFNLRRFLGADVEARYRIFVSEDRSGVRLERID